MDAFIENANKKALAVSVLSAETVDSQKQGVFYQATFQRVKNPQKMLSS